MVHRLLIACCVCLVGVVSAKAGPPAEAGIPPEMARAFAWFDGLGYPPLGDCRLVRTDARSGVGPEMSFSTWSPPKRTAFLVKEDESQFTVFTIDLATVTFPRKIETADGVLENRFEPLDLPVEGVAMLQALRVPAEKDNTWRRWGTVVSERVEVFVMARACAAQGQDRLARKLYDHAASLPENRTGEKPKDFLKAVQDDIALATMWRAVLEFEDPSVSRGTLLTTFEGFVKHFPESEYTPRAKETVEILTMMVREDKEHAAKGVIELDKLTAKDRVAELIYQLREQNGHQWSQPGACDIFLDSRGEESPAKLLVRMSYDAVPQLIEVLDDKRFTRSVGFHRNFYFSHYVLRVGDCAERIIAQIAGRGFYERRSTSGAMVKDGDVVTTRQQIEEWWAELQKKGEKQMLLEATGRGDGNSVYQGERLAKKYPEAALEALEKGIGTASDEWVKMELLRLAGELPGDEAVGLLTETLEKDPWYACRAAAAKGLYRRGHEEAFAKIVDLWNRSGGAPRSRSGGDDSPIMLVDFLLSTGRPEAIRALGRDLARRPIDERLDVIEKLGWSDVLRGGAEEAEREASARPAAGVSPAETRAAAEELLVRALEDTEARDGMSGSWGNWSFSSPRICDAAGFVLAQYWPEKYKYDGNKSRNSRDRQRVRLINQWRKEHGEEPLAEPTPVVIKSAEARVVIPLLRAVMEAKNEETRRKSIEAIAELGLPALKAVHEKLADVAMDDPARADLVRLESRLGTIVREVVLEKESMSLDRSLQGLLDAAKGKPLTANGFLELTVSGLKSMSATGGMLRLSVDRPEELTGIVITVGLFGRTSSGKATGSVGYTQRVSVGEERLLALSGSSSREYLLKDHDQEDFLRAVNKALSTPAERPLEIRQTFEME